MQKLTSKTLLITALSVFLLGCGSNSFQKSPLDEIVRDLPTDEVYSIVLHDMNVEGNFFEKYYHQYRIIRDRGNGDINEVITEWHEVSPDEFEQYVNDMGMEIAARDSTGQLTKSVAPPGYNNYVGNPKYGHWQNSGGSSFWAFYGQYAFLSSMFRMGSYPVSRGYYNDWDRNYRGSGRRYYGPTTTSGGRYYGTGSAYSRTNNPNSSWSRNTSSFKRRVSNRTSRSFGSRTSRSYGSSRSRSGGFGK